MLIALRPGEALRDHGVKESTLVLVLDGSVRVDAGGECVDADAGTLIHFEPDERRSVTSGGGARVLLLFAPWPGAGHYRGDWTMPSGVSAS